METRAHYVAVGAFVLAMVFLAFVGVVYLGGAQLTTQLTHYDIYFKGAVSGLSKGAVVQYNGIPVGKVFDVEIDPNNVEQIRVTVEIDKSVVIKEDAKASVETNILSGVSFILITKGTNAAQVLTAKPDERYPVIKVRRSALASLSARAPELLDQLSRIGDDLDELLDEHNRLAVRNILDNVNKVTGDIAAHDQDFTALLANAKTAFGSAGKFVDDLDQSFTAPNGIRDRLSTALVAFTKTANGIDEASRQIRVTARDLDTALQDVNSHTLHEADDLLHEARQFVAGLTRIGEQIERDPSRLLYGDRREGYHPR
jgi:phospholipid/cholesterol/gamma-HCH transport system substrate-binding protein